MNPPRFFACCLVVVLPWFAVLLPVAGAERIALVIGINDYPDGSNFPDLKNCVNDAKLISKTLRSVGFEVIEVFDADLSEIDEELTRFESKITKGGTALIYFAGHGIEFEKKNYLMAGNAMLQARSRLTREAMEAEVFAAAMLQAGAKSSFLLLDCCREKPPEAEWAGRGRKEFGLAEISIIGDLVISMAAAPGQPALEPGTAGGNSPYARALANWIPSGLKHQDLFTKVRNEVFETTDGQQRPWETGNFLEDFHFVPPPASVVLEKPAILTETKDSPPMVPPPPPANPVSPELIKAFADLAALDVIMDRERTLYRTALDTINLLTKYKTVPVQEGSRSYHECLAASKVITEIEAKVNERVTERARLEATVRVLGGDLNTIRPTATPAQSPPVKE